MKVLLLKTAVGGAVGGGVAAIMQFGFGRDFSSVFYIGLGIGVSVIIDWWRKRRRTVEAEQT